MSALLVVGQIARQASGSELYVLTEEGAKVRRWGTAGKIQREAKTSAGIGLFCLV